MIRFKNGKMGFMHKRVWNIFFISLFLIMYLVLSRHYSLALNETVNETQNQTNQTEPVNLTNQTNVPPYVEPVIYKELVKSEWVQVIIDIYNESTIDLTISNLPPSEFQFERKSYFNNSFSGNITRRGLDLLLNNSAVSAVYLGGTAQVALDKNETIGNETNQSESNVTINQTNLTKPYISPEILKAFENQTWVEILVKYVSDDNITLENEEEMFAYYMGNITIPKTFFNYIPETEMIITQSMLSVLKPSFTAMVNSRGLEKLSNDPRVTRVGFIRQLTAFQNKSVSQNISVLENKTISKEMKDKNKDEKSNFVWLLGVFFIIAICIIIYILINRRK